MAKNKLETRFNFRAKLWKYPGPAGWCFITLSKGSSKKIRTLFKNAEEGWGRLKTTATVGNSSWKTSIWFDTKADAYLLPVKSSVRKKEKLATRSLVSGQLEFDLDRLNVLI